MLSFQILKLLHGRHYNGRAFLLNVSPNLYKAFSASHCISSGVESMAWSVKKLKMVSVTHARTSEFVRSKSFKRHVHFFAEMEGIDNVKYTGE